MRTLTIFSALALSLTLATSALASPPPLPSSGTSAGYGSQAKPGKRANKANKAKQGKWAKPGNKANKAKRANRGNGYGNTYGNNRNHRNKVITFGHNSPHRAARRLTTDYLARKAALDAQYTRITRRLNRAARTRNLPPTSVRKLRRARRAVLSELSQLKQRYNVRMASLRSMPHPSWQTTYAPSYYTTFG